MVAVIGLGMGVADVGKNEANQAVILPDSPAFPPSKSPVGSGIHGIKHAGNR
ncbi:hypothetical protein [Noviherbaspirillum aridicola]|uniref:hypothetical protein n=1 Tax=Noviherbaspirillum aridicola TaxID=2849687 RepID=UPI001C80AA3F|nr:hypothetical protein [Noviherbaspirillum aridicola]